MKKLKKIEKEGCTTNPMGKRYKAMSQKVVIISEVCLKSLGVAVSLEMTLMIEMKIFLTRLVALSKIRQQPDLKPQTIYKFRFQSVQSHQDPARLMKMTLS